MVIKRVWLQEQSFLQELEKAGVFNIVGAKQQLTFEMFWDRYNEKIRSSRKKALIKWQRMNQEQQILAYLHVPKYEQNIPNGIAKKYAETYLNSELWNN